MNLALYCPECGYYEQQKDTVGRRGDFITSVSTGELFGQLLAYQFAAWLEQIKLRKPQASRVQLLEAGAHDGRLAADILNWLSVHRPELFAGIKYVILEPSARRQAWQREMLRSFASHVRWVSGLEELSPVANTASFDGIIFSNELLDAFPVHRYGWDAKRKSWFEWGVTAQGDKLVWAKVSQTVGELPSSILHLPPALLEVLPDNYTVENSPTTEDWWRAAAGVLSSGKLLAIDYGYTRDEQFLPARMNGTLRAYFRHHVGDDLLANPGEQDLTAHVNFSVIEQAGEAAGLKTESFQTQPQFLTNILKNATQEQCFNEWNSGLVRQFQTLIHPEHLGRAFRVLVQSR